MWWRDVLFIDKTFYYCQCHRCVPKATFNAAALTALQSTHNLYVSFIPPPPTHQQQQQKKKQERNISSQNNRTFDITGICLSWFTRHFPSMLIPSSTLCLSIGFFFLMRHTHTQSPCLVFWCLMLMLFLYFLRVCDDTSLFLLFVRANVQLPPRDFNLCMTQLRQVACCCITAGSTNLLRYFFLCVCRYVDVCIIHRPTRIMLYIFFLAFSSLAWQLVFVFVKKIFFRQHIDTHTHSISELNFLWHCRKLLMIARRRRRRRKRST